MSLHAIEPRLREYLENTGRPCEQAPAAPVSPESPKPLHYAEAAERTLVMDWMETHARVMGFWIERLVERGGEDRELISVLHRQHLWLTQMQARLTPAP